ncbi:MAG: hypothetical protein R3D98_10190 [Candidatus Krumholzibacteriia bacterium]
MKKQYIAPQLNVQDMKLGVFGDYGNGGGDDGGNVRPIRIVDRFEIHMD